MWGGSGSGLLGPLTALLSSTSFLSSRAACCSGMRAASSSWNIHRQTPGQERAKQHPTSTQCTDATSGLPPGNTVTPLTQRATTFSTRQTVNFPIKTHTIRLCLWILKSMRLSPTGAGGTEYTVGAAWMIEGVGLMAGRGPCTVDGSDTMETISETCRNTFTDDSRPTAE